MSEQAVTTYPFPDGDDDEVKQVFNIDPRVYTREQKETAATAWSELCSKEFGSEFFVKLLDVCEGSLTAATIVWDSVRFHREFGLKKFVERKNDYFTSKFSANFGTRATYHRCISSLFDDALLVEYPTRKGAPKKFRIDWIELSERLAELSDKLPGLMTFPPVEVKL